MRRRVAVLTVPVLAVLAACGMPPSGTAVAPGADGVVHVRLDHRSVDGSRPPVVLVPRGGTVELVIGSDTAERVVTTGPDQVRYVSAGGTVTVRFVASGTTTVRLGDSGTEIGRLDVR